MRFVRSPGRSGELALFRHAARGLPRHFDSPAKIRRQNCRRLDLLMEWTAVLPAVPPRWGVTKSKGAPPCLAIPKTPSPFWHRQRRMRTGALTRTTTPTIDRRQRVASPVEGNAVSCTAPDGAQRSISCRMPAAGAMLAPPPSPPVSAAKTCASSHLGSRLHKNLCRLSPGTRNAATHRPRDARLLDRLGV